MIPSEERLTLTLFNDSLINDPIMLDHELARGLFVGTENYLLGRTLKIDITTYCLIKINSRPHTCGVIAEMVGRCLGPHLDIGTRHGGTALVAALTQRKMGFEPNVYTVEIDASKELTALFAFGLLRCTNEIHSRFGVSSYPLPWPDVEFETAYIDGSHKYDDVVEDWHTCKRQVRSYVAIDDLCEKFPDVCAAWDIMTKDLDWDVVHMSGIVGVLKRRKG
jgi:hypothetical protein